MLYEIGKEDISPNFRYLRLPELKIFVEMLCANLQSPVWSRHVGGALFSTVELIFSTFSLLFS